MAEDKSKKICFICSSPLDNGKCSTCKNEPELCDCGGLDFREIYEHPSDEIEKDHNRIESNYLVKIHLGKVKSLRIED